MSGQQRCHVLVVDDESVNRMVLAARLAGLGATAVCAANAKLALECFKPGEFDLVITDIQMPGMSGYALLHQLLELDHSLPVVAWTCLMGAGAETFTAAGFIDVLDKPLEVSKLDRLVEQHRRVLADIDTTSNDELLYEELEHLLTETNGPICFFKSRLSERVADISKAFALRDWDEALFAVHKLRGTSRLLGYQHCVDVLARLQSALTEERYAEANVLLRTLQAAADLSVKRFGFNISTFARQEDSVW